MFDVEFTETGLFVPHSAEGRLWLEAVGLLELKESTNQRRGTLTERVARALGEHRSFGWVRDVRGWCHSPVALWPRYVKGLGLWTAYLCPCRRCVGCRRSRAASWTARATHEFGVSARTWLVTLTLGPVARARLRRAAATAEDRNGPAKTLTRLLDRMRHSHGIRYLVAHEHHKDGTPHWHLLIHERERRVLYADIVRQWGLGFVHARLADAEAAKYVAKYATKEQHGRVRASRGYGLQAQPEKLRGSPQETPATV